jgi:V-type H+-transporting ATPase subunit H
LTGPLEWSPVHKSQRFWKENVARFNDENYKLLRMLVEYLKNKNSSAEVKVLDENKKI